MVVYFEGMVCFYESRWRTKNKSSTFFGDEILSFGREINGKNF